MNFHFLDRRLPLAGDQLCALRRHVGEPVVHARPSRGASVSRGPIKRHIPTSSLRRVPGVRHCGEREE